MVEPGGPGSNAQGNLGEGNCARGNRKAVLEVQPVGNGINNGIGAVMVDWGQP